MARRVYLDIVGHIPPADDVDVPRRQGEGEAIEAHRQAARDPAYVRNWTTIWTNLSLGRGTPSAPAAQGMMKFFREAFEQPPLEGRRRDRVADGHYEERGRQLSLAQMTAPTRGCRRRPRRRGCSWACRCSARSATTTRSTTGSRTSSGSSTASSGRRGAIDHRKYDPKTGRDDDDYSELVNARLRRPGLLRDAQRPDGGRLSRITSTAARSIPSSTRTAAQELAKLMIARRAAADRRRDGQPHVGALLRLRLHRAGRRHGPAQPAVASRAARPADASNSSKAATTSSS